MPPPPKVPPRRERWGWDRTETALRHFLPSNRRLLYFTAIYIAIRREYIFPMLRPMQFCELSKFGNSRFTLVFKGSDGFFPRFCERFSLERTQAATMAKYEHPCSKSFCSVESIHRPTRYSVPDFSTLARADFSCLLAMNFNVQKN